MGPAKMHEMPGNETPVLAPFQRGAIPRESGPCRIPVELQQETERGNHDRGEYNFVIFA